MAARKGYFDVVKVLGLEPSEISNDYVQNKKQFQLHGLITEQRHEKTFHLSELANRNIQHALSALMRQVVHKILKYCFDKLIKTFSVDEDITEKLSKIASDPRLLDAVTAVRNAIENKNKIYFYGCGATGRLSKQMESSFWRPFWEKMEHLYPNKFSGLKDLCIGEMTGGDRALISSLEGLEDLQLVGKLQLQDHGIEKVQEI